VDPPMDELVQQQPARGDLRMLGKERRVVVVETSLFEQTKPIADDPPAELQCYDPDPAGGCEPSECCSHPALTRCTAEDSDAVSAFPAGSLHRDDLVEPDTSVRRSYAVNGGSGFRAPA